MPEKDHSVSESKQPSSSTWITTTLLDSFKILIRNKCLFFSVFAFLTLPLSVLHFALSFSSSQLKNHIFHLEALATIVPTRVEARQVWKESREDAVSLLQLKSRFLIPSFVLSLIASITTITSTSLSYHGQNPSFRITFASAKSSWIRVTVTSIVLYALLLLYTTIPLFLSTAFHSEPTLRILITIISSVVEVYIMAVMGLGLVISVLEESYGWEAIQVGSMLIKGRRISGLALSGVLVTLSSFIGHRMERLMEGQDSRAVSWCTAVAGSWYRAELVGLYGAEVLWGYVVTTVFYCECRKRHGSRAGDDSLIGV